MSRFFLLVLLFIIFPITFSSCFTGIESTKKITLSREDKKASKPSKEETFFSGILGAPLEEWENGKKFLATDDKAILMFELRRNPRDSRQLSLKDKTLTFLGVESRMNPSGNLDLVIDFSDGENEYAYDTGREFDVAMKGVLSDEIPLLIDLDMVRMAKEKLSGLHLWTRSALWYNENEERIEGRKFAPVEIVDVYPGSSVFPLKLKITTEKGDTAFMLMNFGNDGNESRAFHNLFSLTNIRKNYPSIEDDIWEYIGAGKIKVGMTKEECKLALGNPSEINSGHDYSQTLDIWTFEDGSILWFEDGRLSRFRR